LQWNRRKERVRESEIEWKEEEKIAREDGG